MKKVLAIFTLLMFTVSFVSAQPQMDKELVSIKVTSEKLKVAPGDVFKVIVKASIEDTWHINSNKPKDEFLIASKIISKQPKFTITKIVYPKAKDINFDFSDKPVSVFEGIVNFEVYLKADPSLTAGKYSIPLELSYQACNNQTCMPPTDVTETLQIEVEASALAQDKNEVQEQPQANSQTTELENIQSEQSSNENSSNEPAKEEDSLASSLESKGLFLSLLIVFLGGLALNLTPCVYPLIPITIGYFGGQAEGRTSRLFMLGILYVLGMSLTYSVIGVVTSLSGAVFGALLQNKFVIIGITLLFIALALSQFGVYEFKLPDSLVAKAGGAKGGMFGAFFMGLTMGVVAAPCIGPFVLGLVTYVAAKGDPFYGFIMFFVLAMGLGFPYLLLALFSGKIKKMPRAGDWMEGVKHIFGFLLLGMAIYFLNPILPKAVQTYALPVFGILSALILLFFDKKANNIKNFRIFKTAFSILVIAVSVWALIPSDKKSPDWEMFSQEKYNSSLNNGEMMIIDFYADWCIPCKELDGMTFSDPRVVEQSKEFTNYKVDMTETLSETTEKLRNQFKVVGVPTVIIINSKGIEVGRINSFVNADEFLKLLQKAR